MLWFRFHSEALQSFKIHSLDDEQFRFWVNCLAVACRRDDQGRLPELGQLAFELHLTGMVTTRLRGELVTLNLIEEHGGIYSMHDWQDWQFQSDSSTERSRKHRSRNAQRSRNVSATPSDTEQIQNRTDPEHTAPPARAVAETVPTLDLSGIFDVCYKISKKRQQRGIAERYFVIACQSTSPELIAKRWADTQEIWRKDRYAARQTFADWLLDRNYLYEPEKPAETKSDTEDRVFNELMAAKGLQ